MKYCSNCGNELTKGSTFCGKCGQKLKTDNKVINSTGGMLNLRLLQVF